MISTKVLLTTTLLITLTFFTQTSPSFFSMFTIITPQNNQVKNFTPLVKATQSSSHIKFSISNITKSAAWLIQTDKPLSGNKLNFRSLIWDKNFTPAKAIVKQIFPQKTFWGSIKKISKTLSISIKLKDAKTSYIYFDHPTPVQDGGEYFTVDVSKFIKN